ncbi:sulfite exporter TauE/SafE family protein 4 isoform X2 [Magnolia sinica]|uniref:sulfite exporter TauE/SafE family protein 4 isoform X2 n=1 Tax=Magnolia sinica TaxID=86752 RepID=UPI00265B3B0A|nr:sulfite exporter TauE/SafE family protein 4 isoform X2 [Magnolia sinica]
MESKGFLLCLLSSFMVAILPLIFLSNSNSKLPTHRSLLSSRNSTLSLPHPLQSIPSVTSSVRVWPDLVFNWRSVLATIIGFLGSAFGTVGGVGGGGIFVPMLNLIVGFDTKSAAALSKCMIMGASTSSVWYNLRVPHPSKNVPIIDYDLALIFQPMLMLGITIGVALSVVFPYWLITVLIIILFLGTSSRSFFKGIEMWKEETVMKMEIEKREAQSNANSQVIIDAGYEPLIPKEEKSGLEILLFNIRWKRTLVLVVVWVAFLLLQIFKNNTAVCSPLYWVLNILQFPVSLSVFGYGALKLYRESKKRRMCGNTETVCEATISWTGFQLLFCALCGILGGTVGGLLGSGGGFILGPLLLEIGVIPQVASATATFVMMFSSSLSVVEFYFLKRFPIPYGVVGVGTSLSMIHKHEYMGFLSFCEE